MNKDLIQALFTLKTALVDELIECLPIEKQEKVKAIERELIQALVVAGQAYLDKTSETPKPEATKDQVTSIKID